MDVRKMRNEKLGARVVAARNVVCMRRSQTENISFMTGTRCLRRRRSRR